MAGEKVFVSSTWIDNVERRKLVEEAILTAEMVPIGMERFTASTEPTVDECVRMSEDADLLVGIVAWRYGWIPLGEQCSITELEYEAASDRLMFLLDSEVLVHPVRDYDEAPEQGEKLEKLGIFKRRFSADQMPARFREENLGLKVHKALLEWRSLRARRREREEVLSRPAPDFEGEILEYTQRVAALHEDLPVAGFRTRLRVPIRLEDLYVPLRVVADLRGSGKAVFADAHDAEQTLALRGEALELPASEAFSAAEERGRRGLVLLGDPGSGKTTQLKRFLLWLVKKGPEGVGLPAGMLPVFLALRDLEDPDADLEAFVERVLDDRSLSMAEGFGRRLTKRGNLLFLLDGLDEVADASARKQVARSIEQLAVAHPDCRFLVSCRFAGYSDEVRLSERFLELHLRPLDARQAEEFVLNWYRIVETGLSKDVRKAQGVALERARGLIDRLREPDFRARKVFELTRNPLLLANLCLVHRDRGQLPKRRADLYGECVEVLLERWRAGKKLDLTVTARDGRRVLQPAAYWMHLEKGRVRATAQELTPHVEPALEAIRWSAGSAKDFLRRIRNESGLLTGWDHERYGFMHLGFQEYLAAREIRRLAFEDPSVLRDLASHHGESWWQEVALLLVALEEPSLFEPYLREVVEQPAFSEVPEALDALLEDAAEVSDRPFAELAGRDPGTDEGLWARQLAALRVLDRMGSSALEPLRERLGGHPSPALRRWLGEQDAVASAESAVSARGGIELVSIRAGSFMMGSPKNERGRDEDEGPQREVTVPAFAIGRFAVTNEEYARFLAGNPDAKEPNYWADRSYNQARQPVVGVDWEDASRFAAWAGCRLPTEAEWEYAARAGTTAPHLSGSGAKDLDRFAWYEANSESRLHPVGEKEPNEWGLYDVLGNTWEWVEDDWHDSYDGAPADGSAWVEEPRGNRRVLRGGSFRSRRGHVRCASRNGYVPRSRLVDLGFRVVAPGL